MRARPGAGGGNTSVLCKVELKKGDALYLNDGAYGSLFDAAHSKWPVPGEDGRGRCARSERGELKPFRFYGPTCDSIDVMNGPFWLPEDVNEGDYIEIGMMGAYGVAMATRFNGYGDIETVPVADAPMASMFGLAGRVIPTRKVGRGRRPQGRPLLPSQGQGGRAQAAAAVGQTTRLRLRSS